MIPQRTASLSSVFRHYGMPEDLSHPVRIHSTSYLNTVGVSPQFPPTSSPYWTAEKVLQIVKELPAAERDRLIASLALLVIPQKAVSQPVPKILSREELERDVDNVTARREWMRKMFADSASDKSATPLFQDALSNMQQNACFVFDFLKSLYKNSVVDWTYTYGKLKKFESKACEYRKLYCWCDPPSTEKIWITFLFFYMITRQLEEGGECAEGIRAWLKGANLLCLSFFALGIKMKTPHYQKVFLPIILEKQKIRGIPPTSDNPWINCQQIIDKISAC
ncbi:MAG: hypothetical protein LLG04_13805 [Parachlamydia sp.]|nr:hypothetical protein [Parachlamydia sp.]